MKDFDGSVRLHQLGPGDFPPLRTSGSAELPSPATPFLGREQELFDAVAVAYERDPRVLTILGPGGTGKTRFAIELVRLLADDADGGTVFVPLAPLRDPALVVSTVADRLGASSPDLPAIAARVGERRTHVVCDNVEHLLPAVARPLAELAGAIPALRLFVTSREPLRIQGEVELDLPPLVRDEAITFFCERAQTVRPDVEASDTVAQLCERLDRLPLALELAAARTKLLTPELLLDRLGNRLDALTGTRDAEERHATLRATIGWSYDLLDDGEQRLFARLGVFRGGCTLETAEGVCGADLDTLASLLDKSLVRRRTGREGEDRYWMLETVREFALERLAASGEADELRALHARRMLAIARDAHLNEDHTDSNIEQGLAEREDLRAALDWAEEADPVLGLEIAVDLQSLWNAAAPAEGMARLERLLDSAVTISGELRARALRTLAGTTDLAGYSERAEPLLEESLQLYERLGDDRGIALVEHMLAVAAWRREDWPRMRQLTEHSLELAGGRFPFIETTGYWLLGQLALAEGDLERATALTRESATRAGESGWTWWVSGQLHELLMLGLRRGDLDAAEREGRAALRLEREQENRLWALYTLAGLAQAALARHDLERAGLLWGAAEREADGVPRWPDERERRGGPLVAEDRSDFTVAYASGRELDLWEAAALVLDEESEPVQ